MYTCTKNPEIIKRGRNAQTMMCSCSPPPGPGLFLFVHGLRAIDLYTQTGRFCVLGYPLTGALQMPNAKHQTLNTKHQTLNTKH